ncbi:MAG TPA: nuclear transport factor 2 family protein [Sphingomicrobium sp.]|nr:nuclear transport factor 2 family protein [Sphingomicrobium sp.]
MQPFLKAMSLTLVLGGAIATTACHRDHDGGDGHHRHAISDTDAAKVTDATVAAWQSMDAGKIDALYAPDVVGFDVSAPSLSTDRANWTKLQQSFAAMKFDHATITQSKTQILDRDVFVFSSVANLTSTAGSVKAMTIRCTDVFRKQADEKFLIVNEHCSAVPGAKP